MFDPLGDFYSYASVAEDGAGWVVSFVASRCYRDARKETCDPYQGRSDHVLPDAWLDVAPEGDVLRVAAARGRFSADDRAELVGYQEPAAPVPARLSFPTARLDPPLDDGGEWTIRMSDLWSGVIPHDDRVWAVCVLELVDDAGDVTWTAPYRVAVGTRGEASRTGGAFLTEVDDPNGGVRPRVTCEPFSGETWRQTSEGGIGRHRNRLFVTAEMRWLPGYVAPGLSSRCEVTLRDRDGDVVKEVDRRGPPGPWLTRRRFRGYFHASIRVQNPKSIRSAGIYCHEA